MFIEPKKVGLRGVLFGEGEAVDSVQNGMELITPTTAEVFAYYDHPQWGSYEAITRNRYGKGTATYIGCMTSSSVMSSIMKAVVQEAGLRRIDQVLAFPVIVKSGLNSDVQTVRYYFNYSNDPVSLTYSHESGQELLEERTVTTGEQLLIEPCGVRIIIDTVKKPAS
jgi:beta-galactosidase